MAVQLSTPNPKVLCRVVWYDETRKEGQERDKMNGNEKGIRRQSENPF